MNMNIPKLLIRNHFFKIRGSNSYIPVLKKNTKHISFISGWEAQFFTQ